MLLRLLKVSGDSMVPAFCDGDYVLTCRRPAARIRVGDVVAVDHPRLGRIIKRVTGVHPDSGFELAGDNHRASTPTGRLGPVAANRIIGKVVWTVPG